MILLNNLSLQCQEIFFVQQTRHEMTLAVADLQTIRHSFLILETKEK